MTAAPAERTGGEALVAQLVRHGVEHAFGVPGESYLAVLDALHDSPVGLVVCRQEGGAAMMAEAAGKLTGRPGVCFVTRGPGASNAFHGLHIAQQDSTPMILFVGQVARGTRGRDTFQELDYGAVFGSVAKWVVEIDDAARVPELVARAFRVAVSGRPGPVVVSLPEDMLLDRVRVEDAPAMPPLEPHPAAADMAELLEMIEAAERPMAIVGGSRWTQAAVDAFAAFAAAAALPVCCSFRRQMLFPAEHPAYAGDLSLGANPRIVEEIANADLVLLAGGRLSEVPSQTFTLLDIPRPRQRLIHVHADPAEIGRVYTTDLGVVAAPAPFAAALTALSPAPAKQARLDRMAGLHDSYLEWSDPSRVEPTGELDMGEVMAELNRALPADAIMCNGAGNYAIWLQRFRRFARHGTQLAPANGSMGYCIPSVVAAKRLRPEAEVVAFAGDGCFLMNGQEFATAVQHDLPFVTVLIDNGQYGTIRMHQERDYPGRVSGTQLRNPDFAAYARAFGGHGETVRRTEEFAPALARARASGLPSILHLHLAQEVLSPTMRLPPPAA
ncbi:MAG: thiamine pyrophosphate-binding protein [Pseudomonadota bacterium]